MEGPGDWLARYGQPLAATRGEAVEFMTSALERALPEGWELRAPAGDSLHWAIVKAGTSATEYGVSLSNSMDLVIFMYGNTDAGVWKLEHALLRSLVIDAWTLRHLGMAACIQYVMSNCEPNQWGLT